MNRKNYQAVRENREMYELIQVKGDSYYIQCPAKIGLIKTGEREVCLIDSGSDKDAGRKARQILEQNNWKLAAIYNTHSHADHVGGNKYLQGQTGCKIYASGIECDFANHPVLEPAFLYGGFPPKELRHKFLMAQESVTEPCLPENLLEGMTAIPLPGHSYDMTGFRTKDDVVYLADCLSSEEALAKYQIIFIYDVAAYLETLERVKEMKAAMFVPSHVQATEKIAPLAQINIDKVQEIADRIEEICKEPVCFEELLQRLFREYSLTMDFQQHALVGSTVRSYLSWMKETGRLEAFFENNMLLWRKV